MTCVAIFTHRRAQEVDGVIDALRARGVNIVRVNWCQYPERSQYTLISAMDGPAELNEAAVGWLHEPYLFSVARTSTGLARDVALRECAAFWDDVLVSLNCAWLNEPSAVRRASSKALQLRLASELSVPSPNYIITNDQARARTFIAACGGGAVIKSLAAGYTEYGEDRFKAYTRRIGVGDVTLLEGLGRGPAILQEEVHKKSEIRVTVVDGQSFSVEIDSSFLPPDAVDIRQLDYAANERAFSRGRNVDGIEAWSREITVALGLSYACLDWVRDEDGREFFLECNPLGSFKWFELCGKWPITDAISSALLKRVKA